MLNERTNSASDSSSLFEREAFDFNNSQLPTNFTMRTTEPKIGSVTNNCISSDWATTLTHVMHSSIVKDADNTRQTSNVHTAQVVKNT